MIEGSAFTCPEFVNGKRLPKHGLRVGFLDVEAYSWSEPTSAACIQKLPKDGLFPVRSDLQDWDVLNPYQAALEASTWHWRVINESISDDLSTTARQYMEPSKKHKRVGRSHFQPHVYDRWCADWDSGHPLEPSGTQENHRLEQVGTHAVDEKAAEKPPCIPESPLAVAFARTDDLDLLLGTPRGTENESPHLQPTYKDSVRGTEIPHVYDLWCDDLTHGAESFYDDPSGNHDIFEGHWQEPAKAAPDGDLETTEVVSTDPIVMSTIEPAQRPLPFAFASASDDAMLDEIILGHPQAHKHLTVRTFGYKRRHLGQRSLQLKETELPHWRHRVQELWIDHDEQPFRIFPIRPPPYLEPHTISVIVQLGDGTADEIVALTQTVHDEAHGLEPTEPIVHSIPHIVTKTGLCLKLNIHQALHSSAVVKQGHAIWLTGFPKTLSNGVYLRVLIDTPTDEAVSLLQESTPTTLCQPQIIQSRLLDDARARNTRPRITSPDDIPVEAPRLLPPHTGGTNRLFPWHLWEELFNNMEGDNFRFVFYGLAVEPIQTRWGSFPEMTDWDLRLHYVTPQPSDPFAQVHVLAEFLLGDALPGPMVPVLRDVRWFAPRNLHRELRAAAYLSTPTNKRLLIEDLAEQCMPDGGMLCSVWTRGEPCLEQSIATLHRGDMVNIRLLPAWQDDIGHGVSFDNGQFFYAYGVTITHQGYLQPLTAYVHFATEATITRSFAGFDVNTLREIGFLANAIWGQDTTVTFCAASSDLTRGMHFLASQTGSEATPILIEQRHLAAGGTYRRRFRMALLLPQMTIAQCIALNTAPHWHGTDSDREILLNSDPITDARVQSTEPVANGALITIIVGDPGERILSADETIHPSDEDTDISDLLEQTLDVRKQDFHEPTVKQCRPNHELIIDRDDIIPYERRFHNGDHFLGRIIPPPNWQSQPVVRQAANVGAARRDGDGQPFILFRTWLLLHEGQSPRFSRNLEIRAQLVVQLSERVRNLWSDLVGIFDAIRVTIVTPTPAREGDDDTRIHVLVERNRPIDSILRPILLSFQQITREGLGTAIEWFPLLAPSVITLPYLQQTCQLPCELHHLLVPLAPSHRGWMAPQQQRHVVPGNYVPGWWDTRRQPPGPEDGGDDNAHLQVSTVRACGTLSYPHVLDLWCDNTVLHTPAQQVDMTHHEIPHDISVGNDALFLMQSGAIKKRRTTESSQSTTPIVQAFHVYRLSTTYELVPAPPPEQGSDVPGYILGLMSTHLGFEATEPARCHPISATIQGLMTLPAFIYEHSGDRFSQQYTDDILALVDITIRGQDNTEHKIRRVLWLRTASTRSALLDTLRCGDICEVMNPPCKVFLNNGFWPELDSVRRHFDFGDYVEILIEADKPVEETLSCLRVAEISDRKRRIFLDTPPPDSPSQEDDQAGDNWVSTSEEQSSEPRDGMTKKFPDSLLQVYAKPTSLSSPADHEVLHYVTMAPTAKDTSESKPHVLDLWCAQSLEGPDGWEQDQIEEPQDINATSDSCRQPLCDITSKVGNQQQENEADHWCMTQTVLPKVGQRQDARMCSSPQKIPKVLCLDDLIPVQPTAMVCLPGIEDLATRLIATRSTLDVAIPLVDQMSMEVLSQLNFCNYEEVKQHPPEKLLVYTDGSKLWNADLLEVQSAWAFVVCAKWPASDQQWVVGFQHGAVCLQTDHPAWVGATVSDSYQAEVVALIFATLWMCQEPLSYCGTQCELVADSTSALFGADGSFQIHHPMLSQVLRPLQRFATAFAPVNYRWQKAHSGEPHNELADHLAKIAAKEPQPSYGSVPFKLSTEMTALQWVWLSAEQANDSSRSTWPSVTSEGIKFLVPEAMKSHDIAQAQVIDQGCLHLELQVTSFNVNSFKDSKISTSGRAELLRTQTLAHNSLVSAWQETRRRKSSQWKNGHHFGFEAAACKGTGGVALWFRHDIPFAHRQKDHEWSPCFFQLDDFVVEVEEPELLVVKYRSSFWTAIFVSAHAPNDMATDETKDAFWKSLQAKLERWTAIPVFLCIDANARLGSTTSSAVGHFSPEGENDNGHRFHSFLLANRLFVPSTFENMVSQPHEEQGTWLAKKWLEKD